MHFFFEYFKVILVNFVLEIEATVTTIHVHLINSVYIILNLLITHRPIKIQHFYHSQLFLIIYILFSVAYFQNGGDVHTGEKSIYPFLNWEDIPSTMGFISGVLAAMFGIHLGLYFTYIARTKLAEKLTSKPRGPILYVYE